MILITSHIGLDFDGFASCLLLTKMYENAKILLPGALEDKLRYFISDNKEELPEFLYEFDISKVEKLIIADTSSISRLPHVKPLIEKLGSDSIVIFDHHGMDSLNINCKEIYIQKTGATTSIITSILKEKKIKIGDFFATAALLGIYEDTNFLSYPGTTALDLSSASWLVEKGGQLIKLNSVLKTTFSKRQIELFNKIISGLERFTFKGRDVAISTFISEKYEADISSILHRVMELESLKLFFCIFQLEDKTYLIAKNNYQDIDLRKLTKGKINGGGHEFVFTANLKKHTIFEIKKIVDEIIAQIPSLLKAGDLVKPAAYTLSENDSVDIAFSCMNRLRINSIAVKNEKGDLSGYVLRQDIDYAISHKFKAMKVKELMNMDIECVDSQIDIEKLRDIFLTSNQKIVFVKLQGDVLGIITRTEAFKRVLIQNSSVVKKVTYIHRLKKFLPEQYYKIFKIVSETADLLNIGVFIVGGFVRDLILRKRNFDFDFVVTNDGIKFAKALAEKLNGKCVIHEKFNTALIILQDNTRLDIATSRFEYYKTPGALPTVAKGHLYHDLYRRDFTINAMAISLNNSDFGHLIDYFGGKKDLKEKTIRVLHSLSFIDDPTRLIRAIRFKNRLKFKIGKTTESLMKTAVANRVYKNISGFRFLKEIKILFSEENASSVLSDLEKFSILNFIDENILIDAYIKDLTLKVDSAIAWHKLLFKSSDVDYWLLYIFAILMHYKKTNISQVISLLNLKKKQTQLLKMCKKTIRYLELFFNSTKKVGSSDSEIYNTLKNIELEILLFAVAYFESEEEKKIISRYITYLSDFKLLINGDDIIQLGIKKGPEIKRILDEVLKIAIDENILDRKMQLIVLNKVIKKDAN